MYPTLVKCRNNSAFAAAVMRVNLVGGGAELADASGAGPFSGPDELSGRAETTSGMMVMLFSS